MPDTHYARCGELSLAYQLFGEGDVDIVVAGSFVSHVELMWTSPEIKVFFDGLAAFARVVVFDKAGVGLSDPVAKVRTVEDRVSELETVMDAAGVSRGAVLGISEGGPAAMLLAATQPERVSGLVLAGTYPATGFGEASLADTPADVLRDAALAVYGETYAVTVEQVERFKAFLQALVERWGTGEALAHLLPSIRSRQQLGMLERMSASPGMARATMEAAFTIDIRHILPSLSPPTLVVHATDDLVPVQYGRYLADHIPGARLVEVDGTDHAPWLSAPDRILSEIERFLTGRARSGPPHRALRTVLFTDIVASTRRAAEMGDQRWHAVLEQLQVATRDAVDRSGGDLIKSTGDGHLATLDGPAKAIRCAEAIRDAAAALGLEIRAGVHTGECELIGDDVGGLAVHIGARVMAHAGPGEILVSSTVRDLVVGSGIGFEERGSHELEGVPGQWTLLAVSSGGPPAGSREAQLVSHPTPGPREAMSRSDRAMSVIARRAPGVVRAMSRLGAGGASRS